MYVLCRDWSKAIGVNSRNDKILVHSSDLDLLKKIMKEQISLFGMDNWYILNLDKYANDINKKIRFTKEEIGKIQRNEEF